MIRLAAFAVLLALCANSFAQKCNCFKELQFLESKMEHNLPSYQDQVIGQKRQVEYQQHKDTCNKIAMSMLDSSECIYLLAKYLSFFRDEHLALNYKESIYPFLWEDNDTAGMRVFFAREKKYAIPPLPKNPTGPEGLWRSKDNKITVQVVKNETLLWDYTGLIICGDKKFWNRGQLKFALKKLPEKNTLLQKSPKASPQGGGLEGAMYECIFLGGTRRPQIVNAKYNGNTLSFGRLTEYHRITDTAANSATTPIYAPGKELEFKELSSKTNYIRIPSFDLGEAPAIDSLIKYNLGKIISRPNLIIDVRDNEGGSDRSYQSLLPVISGKRILSDPIAASIFASPDNIDYYLQHKYDYAQTREDSLSADTTLMLMQQCSGSYTPARFEKIKLDTSYRSPKKVAILADRWCASATEGFLLTALQSSKVKLYGENTWGMCTYGDWITIDLPCLPVAVDMPTKKMAMFNGADLESIGIAPHVPLDPAQKDKWITQVQERLER